MLVKDYLDKYNINIIVREGKILGIKAGDMINIEDNIYTQEVTNVNIIPGVVEDVQQLVI